MIRKVVSFVNDDGFEFTFEPIEDSLSIEKTKGGYEAKYLVQDIESECSPEMDEDESVFLVNYHDDFEVEQKEIIIKEDVRDWYQGRKIKQEKDYYIFPLSCLVHSGVWLSLQDSFVCDPGGWDTSHVGIVLVSRKEAETKEMAFELAGGLIETWNMYLSGDVYGIVKEFYTKEKEYISHDAVWGCYGYEYAKKALEEEM